MSDRHDNHSKYEQCEPARSSSPAQYEGRLHPEEWDDSEDTAPALVLPREWFAANVDVPPLDRQLLETGPRRALVMGGDGALVASVPWPLDHEGPGGCDLASVLAVGFVP